MSLRLLERFFPEADIETEHEFPQEAILQKVVQDFPALAHQKEYLEMLQMGGVHVASPNFSMGIYGLDGDLVPALDEYPVSEGGFLRFADVIFDGEELCEHIWCFAFQVNKPDLSIYVCETDAENYQKIAENMEELLLKIKSPQTPWSSYL